MKAHKRPLHSAPDLFPYTKKTERALLVEAAEYRVLGLIKETGKPAERVLRLLELLRQGEQLRVRFHKRGLSPGSLETIALQQRGDAEYSQFVECMREINLLLKHYRWTPKIVSGAGFYRLDDFPIWDEGKSSNRENWAVRWLLSQAYQGAGRVPAPILRFRQCEECHSWFYAKTDHAIFCSTDCRKKFHSKNPEKKKQRADYMRLRWRPQRREREERTKQIARKLATQRKKGEA
jgi:hypothetical protein